MNVSDRHGERTLQKIKHLASKANSVWISNRINYRLNSPVQQVATRDSPIDVMEADWDTLIVIDAARADLFEEVEMTDQFDSYRRETSRGSATDEWSRKNFPGEYDDTVYVCSNPVPSRNITGSFHEFIEVWKDGFDDDVGTVRAQTVADAARTAHEQHPHKRLIVHFIQPHYPFVPDDKFKFNYWSGTEGLEYGDDDRAEDVWEAIGIGIADPDEVWSAYAENLEYVMDHVHPLVDDLDGRTVIHSDHGNVLGDRSWPVPVQTFGHPAGLRLENLVTVPWAVVDGERREIQAGTANSSGTDTTDIEGKLEALGYV